MFVVEARDIVLWRMVLMFYSGFAPVADFWQMNPLLWKRGAELVNVGLG